MRIYLDSCCLNRPFDDPRQERIRIESFAIERIMARIHAGDWMLVGSDALVLETLRNPDTARRDAVLEMLEQSREWVPLTESVQSLAGELARLGVAEWDAFHLASASYAQVDVMLTVDDRLYRQARRLLRADRTRVELPAAWLELPGKEIEQ